MKLKNLLWIEDDKVLDDTLQQIERIFESNGYGLEWARTGKEAIELLSNKTYEAIILDIMLPGNGENYLPEKVPQYMGGIAILEMIANGTFESKENTKDIALIVFSAIADSQIVEIVRESLKKFPNSHYFFKPMSIIDVVKTFDDLNSKST